MELTYNDGRCSGGRTPRLYLAKGGQVVKFSGEGIAGYCAVKTARYEKNGKWSNTTYVLDLAPGVRGLSFLSPLHGTWGDEFGSWGEAVENLSLPVDVAQAIVRAEYPGTAERLDAAEKFAMECESSGTDAEELILSGGSPTNRAIRDGYWTAPLAVQLPDGTVAVLSAADRRDPADKWTVTDPRVRVVDNQTRPGMHGGYYALRLMAPVGTVQTEATAAAQTAAEKPWRSY